MVRKKLPQIWRSNFGHNVPLKPIFSATTIKRANIITAMPTRKTVTPVATYIFLMALVEIQLKNAVVPGG
jgi:hypothetical protein